MKRVALAVTGLALLAFALTVIYLVLEALWALVTWLGWA